MSRLSDKNDTVVILQNRVFRLDRENNKLRTENNSLLNRVTAAETAARSAIEAHNKLSNELKALREENNQLRITLED